MPWRRQADPRENRRLYRANAWQAAQEFKPDIIFLDIVMQKIDGGDVARQIRTDPTLAQVPIIFLTAIVSQKETNREIGGYPFLAKPVSLDAIKRCIKEHLGE